MSFAGGSLKLKGGQALPVKGGVKKKKKKKHSDIDVAQLTGEALDEQVEGQQLKTTSTPDGVVLDPSSSEDKRTEAEKKFEEHSLKYEEARAKKAASKSHRERIKELNEKLASLTEHNDIFNVSYTA